MSDPKDIESADQAEQQEDSSEASNVELSIRLGDDKIFRLRAVGATVSFTVAVGFFVLTILAVLVYHGFFDGVKKDGQPPPPRRIVDQVSD